MIFINKIKKTVRQLRFFLLIMTILLIIFDLLSDMQNSNQIIMLISLLWLLTSLGYKLNSNISVIIAFICLFFEIIFYVLENNLLAEKLSVWIFIFLMTGLIQLIFEIKNKSQDINNANDLKFLKSYLKKIVLYFRD